MKEEVLFSRINNYYEPFKYFHVEEVLSEEFAEKLVSWFESTSNFIPQHGQNHFHNSTFHISSENIPSDLRNFLTIDNLTMIQNKVGELFNVKFSNKFILSVHRYLPGEGTLVHNDFLEKQFRDEHFFTHRFLIYLNRGWKEEDGGVLGIFSNSNHDGLQNLIPPLHNTGVGLEFSRNSWHAVSAVQSDVRYALLFNFTNNKNLYIDEINKE